MRRLLVISALLLGSAQSHAALTVTGIAGVSNWTAQQNTTTTTPTTPGGTPTTSPTSGTASATVYGGTAGKDAGSAPSCTNYSDFRSTCDSCAAAVCQNSSATAQTPLCACNRARITNDTIVTITVQRAANDFGYIRAFVSATGATTSTEMQYIDVPNPNLSSVSFTWRDVCSRMASGVNSCEDLNSSVVITVCSDKNNDLNCSGDDSVPVTFKVVSPDTDENIFAEPTAEGVGDFTPFPGDDRIYITDINTTTNFPNITGYQSTAVGVKVFLSDVDLASATPASRIEPETTLPVVTNTDQLGQDYVDDVVNGKPYYVRLGILDQANNIVQFYPNLTGTDHSGNAHPECFTGALDPKICPFAVIPDQVLGLLSKDFNCFIASAAYGTSLEPKLDLFRRFRNHVLLRHDWGKSFVMGYYTYGPVAARFIHDKPVLRWMARGALWPLAGFSWLALQIGLVKSLLIVFTALFGLAAVPFFAMRRTSPRA